jgi:putative component of toxin-antitoxin plasmid stabilization module
VEGDLNVVSSGNPIQLKSLSDGVYELDLAKGEEALLYAGRKVPDVIISPVLASPGDCNPWGVKVDSRKTR